MEHTNLLRHHIRKILFENLSERDKVFNYYTNQSEQEETFFGRFPLKKYGDQIIDHLVWIMMEEEGVSEKSFSLIDEIKEKAKNLVLNNEEFIDIIKNCNESNNRIELCAELIYSKVNSVKNFLTEVRKNEFEKLKDNKVPLTDEERKECFRKDAVWNYASSINPITGKKEQKVCAIWKSKNKDGSFTYGCHTHRAWNSRPTLKGAIKLFHDFIKGTA